MALPSSRNRGRDPDLRLSNWRGYDPEGHIFDFMPDRSSLWRSGISPPASPAVLNNLSALDFRFNFPEVNLRAGLPQWMTSRSPLAR